VSDVLGEAIGEVEAHDDGASLDGVLDDGRGAVDGADDVGAAGVLDDGADDFGPVGDPDPGDFPWCGLCARGGPGSTGGTRGVVFGGFGACGPTGTIIPTPAA
jgi:hypothetical protein